MSKPKPSKCKTCGAPIYWAIDVHTGTKCPVDAASISGGNVILTINARGEIKCMVLGKDEEAGDKPTHLNHWVTCAAPPARAVKPQHKGGTPA